MGKAEFNARLGGAFQVLVDSDGREGPLLRVKVSSGEIVISISSNDEVEIHRLIGVFRKALRFLEEDCLRGPPERSRGLATDQLWGRGKPVVPAQWPYDPSGFL
jgi:hypothetical protein